MVLCSAPCRHTAESRSGILSGCCYVWTTDGGHVWRELVEEKKRFRGGRLAIGRQVGSVVVPFMVSSSLS